MNKKAFSLIELSIVILIIGILVAGVTQSSRLIREFRLKTAQNLTQSSPVNSIKDLAIWFEASLEKSFDAEDQENDLPISTWYDINPQSALKSNATQATGSQQPLYIASCINSLPCARFDGINDKMDFDGSPITNSNYTIFIVESRRNGEGSKYFLSGSAVATNGNLQIGYRNTSQITHDHFGNDYNVSVASFVSNVFISRIHVFSLNQQAATVSTAKLHYLNGALSTKLPATLDTAAPLVSWAGSNIAHYGPDNSFYNGDIAEIIIFTRALKNEERQSIEEYLSKKYNITIS